MQVMRSTILWTASGFMVAALPAFGQANWGVVKTFEFGAPGSSTI